MLLRLVICALSVFFAWEAAVRPLLSLITWELPAALDNLLKSVVVAVMAWAAMRWPYPQFYEPMAVAGLVALLGWRLRGEPERPENVVSLRTRRGVPMPGD